MTTRFRWLALVAFLSTLAACAAEVSSENGASPTPPADTAPVPDGEGDDAGAPEPPPLDGATDSGPTPCTRDVDCASGKGPNGRICATSGAEKGTCIEACHADADCPAGHVCDTTAEPHWVCRAADAGTPSDECAPLAFPSGVMLATTKDAATTSTYAHHLKSGQAAPSCFLDVDHLRDPRTGATYDLDVALSAHFTLRELVGSEVTQYGRFVLIAPSAVKALEAFRVGAAQTVPVTSGFRSPKHQEDTCRSLCGNPLGCAGTCANASRHMWGDAFDLPLAFYSRTYTQMACDDGFKFAYLESQTHLHVDQNPAYATCVQE